ncbi:MAG: linear amide C-N hydrolase [Clostridia bacterium]|nr:linear amide C-N hydrolase [Clostridia bacterium]
MDVYFPINFRVTELKMGDALSFSNGKRITLERAILGSAAVIANHENFGTNRKNDRTERADREGERTPLFADAMNSSGLCMAGLDFPGYASYSPSAQAEKRNVAPYEMIAWVLSQCDTADQAEELLRETSVMDLKFNSETPNTPLHWLIADGKRSLAVEPTERGLAVCTAESNTLTNAPDYLFHAVNLRMFGNLSAKYDPPSDHAEREGIVEKSINREKIYRPFSCGFGGIGLPGDFSSPSRFVRAAFLAENSVSDGTERGRVAQFFRVLSSVAVPNGAVLAKNGQYDLTVYSSCMDAENGKYYFLPYPSLSAPSVRAFANG